MCKQNICIKYKWFVIRISITIFFSEMVFERDKVAQSSMNELTDLDVDVYNQTDLELAVSKQVCIYCVLYSVIYWLTILTDMFSDPHNINIKDMTAHLPEPPISLDSIEFDENDIIQAIDKIYPKSSTADNVNDIPAKIIKAYKKSLAKAFGHPVERLIYESIIIPQWIKNQIIAPVHKKVSKVLPENYRPIS